MRVARESNGQILVLDPSAELGAGGEARIYAAPANLAAKIYHRPDEAQARKLAIMVAHPPRDPMLSRGHSSIAWPVDRLREVGGGGRVVGFLMPRVRGLRPLVEFYNPKLRRQNCPFFDYRYLHRTARNLAAAVAAVHSRGHVVGDLNESNVLASETALVTLVDTDSFQVRDPKTGATHRCPVGKPEFTPPELQGKAFRKLDRSTEHDAFGLAVLLFQLLMEGAHPFAGIVPGREDPRPWRRASRRAASRTGRRVSRSFL